MAELRTAEDVLLIINSLPDQERAKLIAELKRQDFLRRWPGKPETLSDEEINRIVEENRKARCFYN
jgi:hypothetical protein